MALKKMMHPRSICIVVDGDIFDKFVEQLPRRKPVSEAIRELINIQVEETEKEKNAYSPRFDQSAIKAINNKLSDDFNLSQRNKQPTIDFFCIQREDIPKLVGQIDDKQELGWMIGQCKEFIKLSNRILVSL